MTRRWLLRVLILFAIAVFIVWLEPTRVAWGWLRGESFYVAAPPELTPEERTEIIRLYMSPLSEADLQQCLDWEQATSFEEFLRQLEEEQRQLDEAR